MDSATFHHIVLPQARTPARPETISIGSFPSRVVRYRDRTNRHVQFARCSMRTGVDSNSPRNKNPAVEADPASLGTTRHPSGPLPPDKAAPSTSSRGLVLDLGHVGAWDCAEIGSPVVKRYVGDNEERWFMWYHGKSSSEDGQDRDSIGIATSGNGIHWSRGDGRIVRSCREAGMVMECRDNWWAFDTEGIRPAELVVMSSPMYSSVYWLYYTGYTSEEVEFSVGTEGVPRKARHSLPGLACSQDGRHWARIEGDHHSGAVLDAGSGSEWDSLFIASPKVVVHSSDDIRMYYHSFDQETGRYAVGFARSRDGIRWVKFGKITIGGESTGSFEELGVRSVSVVRDRRDGTYVMAYEAVAADGRPSIGVAVSEDGLKEWRRVGEGPSLVASGEGGWDALGVGSPSLVQMDGHEEEWRMYYVGIGVGGRTGIGMAVSNGSGAKSFRRWSGISLENYAKCI